MDTVEHRQHALPRESAVSDNVLPVSKATRCMFENRVSPATCRGGDELMRRESMRSQRHVNRMHYRKGSVAQVKMPVRCSCPRCAATVRKPAQSLDIAL